MQLPSWDIKQSLPRRGMTLIELLVVVMIMVILLGIALPAVRPALEDRKVREASRQFNAFLRAAQARAAKNNAPYGVWISRTDNADPNISYQLYYAETPAPYVGEVQDASVVIPLGPPPAPPQAPMTPQPPVRLMTHAPMGGLDTPSYSPSSRYSPAVLAAVPWVATRPPAWLARVTLGGAFSMHLPHRQGDPTSVPLVNRGDLIRFNFTGPDYLVYDILCGGPPNDSPLTSDDPTTTNTVEPAQPGDLYEGPQPSVQQLQGGGSGVEVIIGPAHTDIHAANAPPHPGSGPIVAGSRFQIVRQPRRVTAGSLSLPNGTAIALSVSGTNGVIRYNQMNVLVDDFNEFAPASPTDASPVLVMFRPDGSVDKVASSNFGVGLPNGPVHFLIGRSILDERTPVVVSSPPPATPDELTWQNLNDQRNLWVTVGHRTGAITTASMQDWSLTPGVTLGDTLVTKTRAARGFTRNVQSVGGN